VVELAIDKMYPPGGVGSQQHAEAKSTGNVGLEGGKSATARATARAGVDDEAGLMEHPRWADISSLLGAQGEVVEASALRPAAELNE
jgi:hypothetical protein